jgi:hypothetical protein
MKLVYRRYGNGIFLSQDLKIQRGFTSRLDRLFLSKEVSFFFFCIQKPFYLILSVKLIDILSIK